MKLQKITPQAFAWTVLALVVILLCGCEKKTEQALLKAELNMPAPDFTLTDLQGKTWQLSELRGNVVFLNFWATWCTPCLEEMPAMEALNRKLSQAPFKMITVLNNDRPEYAQAMVQKIGSTFPVLIDPESKVGSQYGLTGVPETFIIDHQGILRQKFLGPRPWDSPEAVAMISQYFPASFSQTSVPVKAQDPLGKSH